MPMLLLIQIPHQRLRNVKLTTLYIVKKFEYGLHSYLSFQGLIFIKEHIHLSQSQIVLSFCTTDSPHPLNLCPIYLHSHNNFQLNNTKIKEGCQLDAKAAPQDSWNDLTLDICRQFLESFCFEFNVYTVKSQAVQNAGLYIKSFSLQVNQITSFLDGSQVYGSEMSTSRSLRLSSRGRLRVTRIKSEELLPLAPEECADFQIQRYCFAAGLYPSLQFQNIIGRGNRLAQQQRFGLMTKIDLRS